MNKKSKAKFRLAVAKNPEAFRIWAQKKNEEYSAQREKRRKELGLPDKIGRSIASTILKELAEQYSSTILKELTEQYIKKQEQE